MNGEIITLGELTGRTLDTTPAETVAPAGVPAPVEEQRPETSAPQSEPKVPVEPAPVQKRPDVYQTLIDSIDSDGDDELAAISEIDKLTGAETTDKSKQIPDAQNNAEEMAELSKWQQQRYKTGVTRSAVNNNNQPKADATTKTQTMDDDDLSMLMPAYDDDSSDTNELYASPLEIVDTAESPIADITVTRAEYAENAPLPVKRIREPEDVGARKIRRRLSVGTSPVSISNQLADFKRDNFGVTRIPMVNSGYTAEIIGLGIIDLIGIYANEYQYSNEYDYRFAIMDTVFKSISSTIPPIPRSELALRTHYADYQLAGYGQVCSTLQTVKYEVGCKNCGKPFVAEIEPEKLLLNADEIQARKDEYEHSTPEQSSLLLNHNYLLENSMLKIELGPPNYYEAWRIMREYREMRSPDEDKNPFAKNRQLMTDTDWAILYGMMDTLMAIRSITMKGVTENADAFGKTLFGKFRVIKDMLTKTDIDNLTELADLTREGLVYPKFGFRRIVCPFCGDAVENKEITSLHDLVFYHTQAQERIDQLKKNKSSEKPGAGA